ncbi:MAG: methyltransferase domain-containing protein [Terriglobales bacterium]
MHDLFVKHQDILCCPKCRNSIHIEGETLACQGCGGVYRCDNGIPQLFHPHEVQDRARDVTDVVKQFYEDNPFPNYDDLDSKEGLAEKANRGIFARLLDEQMPGGALVLECGCGTGQLSNFLGIRWHRAVFGSDLCLNSLRLAERFRCRCDIKNAGFLQMNLFRPAFLDKSFDLVISNGVLHHTGDPLGGFQSVARLVKPGRFVVIGLYNTIGRLGTDFLRLLLRVSGDRLRFLDAHIRNKGYNDARKRAWFLDQYKHPHESKHSYGEVLVDWFEANGFEFLSSVPKLDGPFTAKERLFEPHDRGTRVTRFLMEVGLALRHGDAGGLFIMIGRRAMGREDAPNLVRVA